MIFPSRYKALSQNTFQFEEFQIVPIRYKDRLDIMKWRNEQMYHLRQSELLTKENQESYYQNIVSKLFTQNKPNQLLFSFLKNDKCIGYGGLVHIDWESKSSEISFIMDVTLEEDNFEILWTKFLKLIEKVAFTYLNFNSVFTYAFDLRQNLYPVLEKNNYLFKKRIKNQLQVNNKWFDVVIHEKRNQKISIRKSTKEDGTLLFDWANEKVVRTQSFNSSEIKLVDHLYWYKTKLENPNFIFYIVEIEKQPLGLIRIEIGINHSTIGITIDEKYRGQGLSSKALSIGCREYFRKEKKPIFAFIKKTNIFSVKTFKSIGFEFLNETLINGIPSFTFQLNKS
jgi:RimJ/RimL family protein N-acetyltransferase|tara:strand:+ start:570 stop:1589 length:1020 start_codon:yes stop_codon:yes gene_type:complete